MHRSWIRLKHVLAVCSLAGIMSLAPYGFAADGDDVASPAPDASAAAADAKAPTKIDSDQTIDAFLAHAREAKLDANLVAAAEAAILAARTDGVEPSSALTEGLATLYPEYQEALIALAEEKFDPAIAALEKLSAHADPYLAADAAYFAARGYISQDRYEEALPRLEGLVSGAPAKSLQAGNALFFVAVAQAGMLQRKEAIQSFERFLVEYPQASERMRVGAFRQLEQLKYIEEGALSDVFHKMEFSRRRLSLGNTDDQTRGEQDKIVDMLSQLIAQAEEKECNCRGGGEKNEGQNQGQGQGGGKPGEGAGKNGQGGNNSATDETVRRVYRQGPQSPWSRLREKERDPAFSAIKEKFPARYLELVEQYYKSFQDVQE